MIKVEGIDSLMKELQKRLNSFTPDEQRKVMRGATEIILEEAKANVGRAPINDGGRLQRSIKILPKFRGAPGLTFVGPRVLRRITEKTSQKRKDANPFYAHWWEYGTAPHDLSYQGKYISERGGTRGQHPGSRKFPYMRPAYDTKAREAIEKAFSDITKMIEK